MLFKYLDIALRLLSTPLFPRKCAGCDGLLNLNEEYICYQCLTELEDFINPYKNLSSYFNSFLCPIRNTFAAYLFSHNNVVRHVIHSIKYHRHKDAGVSFGKLVANTVNLNASNYDIIVPIPIHNRKRSQRGYNQTEQLAKGIAEVMGIPINNRALVRLHNTTSQTSKHRQQRAKAMVGAFGKGKNFPPMGLRILLIDDVLTTGATLASAAKILAESKPKYIDVLVSAVDTI